MDVRDLNQDQKTELKTFMYSETHEDELSYGELASIDYIITDSELYEYYDGVDFTCDDFFCSAGQYDMEEV